MSSWRQQALIEAPVDEVWRLVADPTRYPEWGANVVAVTGEARVTRNDEFRMTTRDLLVEKETTFRVVEHDELREIKLQCETSGFYSHWLLTEARENTFLEVEIGMEPGKLPYRVIDTTVGKRWYRRLAEDSIDGIRGLLSRRT
jgi:ribosome-associated toxin RatA of RatAB toxin-antitoxin module